MTREEEKRKVARRYATHDVDTDETDFYGNYVKKEDFVLPEFNAFLEGCKWSDKNPKSPWISVDDDLPCNHEELIFLGGLIDGSETIDVFVRYESGDIWCDYMICTNGKWRWSDGEPDYWMIAPKLPKE